MRQLLKQRLIHMLAQLLELGAGELVHFDFYFVVGHLRDCLGLHFPHFVHQRGKTLIR